MSTSSLTRAATVAVGGVVVDGVVIAHDPSFDTNQLSQLSSDVGYTIDGSLGGTFLHDFYVTVDYAKEQLTLARYQDLSFILDQGELIGITLGVVSGTGVYEVTAVSGDAATKKVSVNDVVTAIDGTDLASVSSLQVAALIYGKVGSTKQVTFGKAAKLANMTVPILVDETLPLPSAG
jgi:C-terminal processing protease CtpA/Prc